MKAVLIAIGTSGVFVASSCARTNAPNIAADEASKPSPKPAPTPPPVVTDASNADGAVVVLPPRTDSCTSDSDCGVTSLDLTGPTVCCFRCCTVHGGSKSWTDAIESICKSAPKTCVDAACACPMPPYKPKCDAGRCILVY